MIFHNSFEEAFLDVIQHLVSGDTKEISLCQADGDWFTTGTDFTFYDNTPDNYDNIFKIVQTLFKYQILQPTFKEINIYYNVITKEYDYDIMMTV